MYIRCKDKFDVCTKSCSWLGQKVNKDWWRRCIWSRCRWIWLGLDSMAMGWRCVLPRHLDTFQYSNRIWSHWIFVF